MPMKINQRRPPFLAKSTKNRANNANNANNGTGKLAKLRSPGYSAPMVSQSPACLIC